MCVHVCVQGGEEEGCSLHLLKPRPLLSGKEVQTKRKNTGTQMQQWDLAQSASLDVCASGWNVKGYIEQKWDLIGSLPTA